MSETDIGQGSKSAQSSVAGVAAEHPKTGDHAAAIDSGAEAADKKEPHIHQATTGDRNKSISVGGDHNLLLQVDVLQFIAGLKDDMQGVAAPRIVRVKFELWSRKTDSYEHASSGLESTLQHAVERLIKDHLVIIENRLPEIAEDLFESICNSGRFPGKRLEACCVEDATEGLTLGALISAVKHAGKGSLIYVDLHNSINGARTALRNQLESGYPQFAGVLKREDVFCFIASPPSSAPKDDRVAYLSFDAEETILVNRASIRGGQIQPIIANKIREQIALSLWRDSDKRLRLLDDLIRSAKIEARVDEVAAETDQVAADSRKYASWLCYLLGFGDVPDEDRARRLRRAWSEEVTCALVERALFVLTSFDQLGPRDFDFLMRTLLNGKTVVEQVQQTDWVAVDEPSQTTGTSRTVIPTVRERSRLVERSVALEDAYLPQADRLLALLDVRTSDDGSLEFEPAFKTQVARRIFASQKSIQAGNLFLAEAIEKSILFDAPIHIAEQLASRYAEHASRLSPRVQKEFISNWMNRSARHFIEERIPEFKSLDDDNAPELKLLLEAILSREYALELSWAYAERASLLLSRLLSDPKTRDLVDYALDRLMVEGQDADGKHVLILMFVRILRSQREFNALRWLKRLLAEGTDEAKRSALNLLGKSLEESERANLLDSLLSWMPSTERASGLNNQTAALLAPRIALHRAFSRTREREHGAIDQLLPLFDLSRDEGLVPEFEAAIKLLTADIEGTWIQLDLSLVDQLMRARWGLDEICLLDGNLFPAVAVFDPDMAANRWNEEEARRTSLIALFVEAIALILGNPLKTEAKRAGTMEAALKIIASHLPADELFATYRRAYEFGAVLDQQTSEEAERRADCARWIGDTLYHSFGSRTSPPQ